jgi:nitroreductase
MIAGGLRCSGEAATISAEMDILPEILARRTIRSYSSESVDKAALDRVLDSARLAPSAKNRQEWRFIVVQKKEIRARIQEASFGQEHVGSAPVIVAACTTNVDYRMPNGQLSYPMDLSFAACHMVLQATREGLGTSIVTTFDEQEIQEILTVPYSMRVVLLVLIGHADGTPEPAPRKPLKRVVSLNHW